MKDELVNLNYVQDLKDAFELDCSKEELEESKEAKECYRVIRKICKRADKLRIFLDKLERRKNRYETDIHTKRKSERIW